MFLGKTLNLYYASLQYMGTGVLTAGGGGGGDPEMD